MFLPVRSVSLQSIVCTVTAFGSRTIDIAIMSASNSGSDDLKGSPDVTMMGMEPSKLAQKKNQTLVLIPQPSDDPQDPLVSHQSSRRRAADSALHVEDMMNTMRMADLDPCS